MSKTAQDQARRAYLRGWMDGAAGLPKPATHDVCAYPWDYLEGRKEGLAARREEAGFAKVVYRKAGGAP